jgi:hypothetical protein
MLMFIDLVRILLHLRHCGRASWHRSAYLGPSASRDTCGVEGKPIPRDRNRSC